MDWVPTLSEGTGPAYRRIVDALSTDIAGGRLRRGQQLPTHRALAKALGIDLTTVTRAYGEARRRGLLDAHVGRGTFVSETTARAAGDLLFGQDRSSHEHPAATGGANLDTHVAQGFKSIQNGLSFSAFLTYQRPGGSDDDRVGAANWLRAGAGCVPERSLIYPGTRRSFNVLLSLTSPGDVVLTEALTFPGMKAAAGKLGVRLVGVAMDEEGILPDAT